MLKSTLSPIFIVLLFSIGQLGLKLIGNRLTPFETLCSTGTMGLVVLSGLLYSMSIIGWLYILSYMSVSRASMFFGLSFVFIPVLAWACLGEKITITQAIGASAILFGVVLSTQA